MSDLSASRGRDSVLTASGPSALPPDGPGDSARRPVGLAASPKGAGPAGGLIINRDIGEKPVLKFVPVDAINVDRNYQRDIRPQRVKQILREFSWEKFGALQLAEQEDGRFNVFDGQHRHEAARLHPDIDAVPAVIIHLTGARAEAEAFLGVNINRTAVTPIERYWAGLEAGDADMMAVCAVLEDAGCEVIPAMGCGLAANRTAAVSALSRAIKRFGEGPVIGALKIMRAAWPDDRDALKGTVITSLARILKNNPKMSRERMTCVMRESSNSKLSADAEAMRKIAGGDATTSITRTLTEFYNRGLRTGQIVIGVKI